VWGGDAGGVSSNTLQSHMSSLRRVLGVRNAIVARAPGYLLDLGDEARRLATALG